MGSDLKRPIPDPLPSHVAIIMDGNGRWAEGKGLPRLEGHRQGHQSCRAAVRFAGEIGLEALTLYIFSSENWNRPKDEVEGLMAIIEYVIGIEIEDLHRDNVRVKAIGRLSELPASLQLELKRDMELTAGNTGLKLNLAINYGGRAEIVDAVRQAAQLAVEGKVVPAQITEELFSSLLYCPDVPDPDLLIRTGGDMRVSNFLVWESAYSELYVTPVLWPDFREGDFLEALEEYARRERRFGGVKSGFEG
jgi:undecaprenyl diphosphate synthase